MHAELAEVGGIFKVIDDGDERLGEHLRLDFAAVPTEQRLELRVAGEEDLIEAQREIGVAGEGEIQRDAEQGSIECDESSRVSATQYNRCGGSL